MTTPNARNIVFAPGRLSYGATSLTTDYPHGGTALGNVRAIRAIPGRRYEFVRAEEFGGERIEALDVGGDGWVLSAILRGCDNDAYAALFPNTSVGTTSQHRLITETASSTNRAGRLLASTGVRLVFTPYALEDHNFLVLHRAVPMLDATASLAFSLSEQLDVAVVFAGFRDSTGKSASYGRRRDITL